jgi:hypothetical protein
MAVPKKKVSFSNIKKRYTLNNTKLFSNRRIDYKLVNFIPFILKKENWMPVNLIKHKRFKFKISKKKK